MVLVNGLPALRLYPGDETTQGIAMVMETEASEDDVDLEEETMESNETSFGPSSENELDSNETSSDLGSGERHLPLHESKKKTMTRGQKKQLSDSLEDMEKEDCAMWSVLQGSHRRHKRMLPRGCKSFLMEIFAGAATLSCLAVGMGLSISAPVDIEYDSRYNLLVKDNRDRLWQEIEDEDPFLLTMAPLCGPWSSWQRMNVQKSEDTYAKIMEERRQWYPVVQWLMMLIEHRLELGREVLLENPWLSLLWELRCVEGLMEKQLRNQSTGEPLDIIKIDQHMYGLVGDNGVPQQKSTGLMMSSAKMKEKLNKLCDRSHAHEQLEGGKTKKAQQWPEELCRSILEGALEELQSQTMRHAFPAEFEQEDRDLEGTLDGIEGLDDIAEPMQKRRKIDLHALDTEEDYEQNKDEEVERLLHLKERERKEKWLKISREERIAIRRLHQMMGHCSTQALVRMLKSSLAKKEVIDAAQHFRCQSCDEVKSDERPRTTRPMNPAHQIRFNDELAVDVFEIVDVKGSRHSILSMVDMATHYHVAVRVCPGGTPSSKVCAEAINNSWLSWAGAPRAFVCDQGVHNRGRVAAMLQSQGTEIRRTGARAPHQLGTAERHGGMLKEMLKRSIHDRQLFGSQVIAALCSECARAKNVLINHSGYSPAQWVLGHTPEDLTSLGSQDPETHLGVHQGLVDAEEKTAQEQFMMQLLMRQTAKEIFMQVDSSQRIRKAMLRKAVPLRGPYRTGDLVRFSKLGKWYGPARVLATEGKSSLWLVHGGVTVLVAETSCRPASAQEVMKKHILELRPANKRKRELYSDDINGDYIPFADDGDQARALRQRTEQQAPFIDAQEPMETTSAATTPMEEQTSDSTSALTPSGVTASPGDDHQLQSTDTPLDAILESTSQEEYTPSIAPPPGLEEASDLPGAVSATMSMSSQPEFEPGVTPEIEEPAAVGQEAETETPLTRALRLSPDRLDGLHVHDEALRDCLDGVQAHGEWNREATSFAFLGSRQESKVKKKVKKVQRTKKTGAGRELNFDKETPEIQQKLLETRAKEWSNWTKYTDGQWLNEEQLADLKQSISGLRIIPTRWVDVNKAEPTEEDVLKSRLVVRGDLEDSSKMRTDSPTCSMVMLSLSLSLSACRDTDLWTGDISAAFLQGSKLDRTLVLSMPKGGIPGEPPGRYYMVSSTVYGTKDAPRGWFKNLNSSLLEQGFVPVPHEAAAYRLSHPDGSLAGLVVVHVDDLLWTGGSYIEEKMKAICDKYKFGKLSKNEFRYCGREIKKDSNGIHVSCPSLVDRVRPIYMSGQQRKNKDEKVPDNIKDQLRSIVGSLAWLARVCRPDLSYAVSFLQSNVNQATYGDVAYANSIVKVARNTKELGITFPLKPFKFEEAMVVGIQDASFANDAEVSKSGQRLGLRSQSGRLLCLAHESFQKTHEGHLLLLDWHSTCIRRVCRSTLQAESMSMISGMEESERLRFVLHGLHKPHGRDLERWQIEAQDEIKLNLYTDCHSLYEHAAQPGLHTVGDKRLAIDLSAARQLLWRSEGELLGDPLLTDHLPEKATSALHWIPTWKMAADSLTKSMKPGKLLEVMCGSRQDLTPEKQKECENEGRRSMEFRS